jgi:hypothetical protein
VVVDAQDGDDGDGGSDGQNCGGQLPGPIIVSLTEVLAKRRPQISKPMPKW